jgi:phosphatidate cytidylyltransferase
MAVTELWPTAFLNSPVAHFGLFVLCFFILGISLIYCTKLGKKPENRERVLTQVWIYLSIYLVSIAPIWILTLALIPLNFFILKELLYCGKKLGNTLPEISAHAVVLCLSLIPLFAFFGTGSMLVALYFIFILGALLSMYSCEIKYMVATILWLLLSCLIILSLDSILYFRSMTNGSAWCLFALFLTNASDLCAFLGGGLLGKKPLCPEISANKTIEGSLLALLGTLMFAFVFKVILALPLLWWQIILLAIAVSVSGQLGDLIASLVKRKAGLKDFGNALPGNGGFLDRCDSLLLTLPILMSCLFLFGI